MLKNYSAGNSSYDCHISCFISVVPSVSLLTLFIYINVSLINIMVHHGSMNTAVVKNDDIIAMCTQMTVYLEAQTDTDGYSSYINSWL